MGSALEQAAGPPDVVIFSAPDALRIPAPDELRIAATGGLTAAPDLLARAAPDVLTLAQINVDAVETLLSRHGLKLQRVADGEAIPGSYWGDSEAGLIADTVFARSDTPVHSLLHEAAHLLVMPEARRDAVHTDASDSIAEEDAACYLQILLAGLLPGVGSDRLMADMDAWGYSFRLGSARAWFEHDAEDARLFLQRQKPALWVSCLKAQWPDLRHRAKPRS